VSDDLSALCDRVRILEDKEAIRTLLATIARGTDRYDGTLLAGAIHADAVLDMGGKVMTGAAFIAALRPPMSPRPGRMHILGNECIGVAGDAARSESYLVSCQDVLVDDLRKTRIRAGRYIDRFERRDGEWKLAARTMIDEWARIDTVSEAIEITGHSGRPAPDDISYQL
jgi:hypothetical protein